MPSLAHRELSLLGASAALGMSTPLPHADWPSTQDLADVLELNDTGCDSDRIAAAQARLWLGLREMARMHTDTVFVSPRLADRILDL
jgi:hypothetical protein